MTGNADFIAKVDAAIAKRQDWMQNVMRESVQDVLEDAQKTHRDGGRMRVDTGFLINSVVSALNGKPTGSATSPNVSGANSVSQYTLTIAQMKVGDIAYFAWTADYARVREHYDQFLGVAAAKFQNFVSTNSKRV